MPGTRGDSLGTLATQMPGTKGDRETAKGHNKGTEVFFGIIGSYSKKSVYY